MSVLRDLSIHRVRNITEAHFQGFGGINVFCGDNGSGKTSLLESIYMLGMTRSFRSRRMDTVISRGDARCVVRGAIQKDACSDSMNWIGVQRSRRDPPLVKLDGRVLPSLGEMAGLLPLQLIDAESFRILEGGPGRRRQLLDWGVFHVERQRFFQIWRRYRRSLQQRNALLRRGRISSQELESWSRELVESGTLLHEMRAQQHQELAACFARVYSRLSEQLTASRDADQDESPAIELFYLPGWDSRQEGFGAALAAATDRDSKRGFTSCGPHRADIRIRADGSDASESLSRGQIKTVVCALRIAQADVLRAHGQNCVFLIDDLPAELDRRRRQAICGLLLDMDLQLFVTSIQAEELDDCWQDREVRRFHVEHGRVHPC